uniref:Peptidase M3A/M3B catalytic domain-containing protein n=1 Tax=Dunaliella tertiolecta TaxID=3047 RepID=A0A7S3QPV1_DUNTE
MRTASLFRLLSPNCRGVKLLHQLSTAIHPRGNGLFGLGIHRPQCFVDRAADARHRCQSLIAQILASPADASVVQLMDDMSDELCRTYDAAEACRNIHMDQEWKRAATKACVDLGAYIAEVNNHSGIYSKLSSAMSNYQHTANSTQAFSAESSSSEKGSIVWSRALDTHDASSSSSSSSTDCAGHGLGSSAPQQPFACTHTNTQPPQLLSDRQLRAFCPETVMVGIQLKLDMEKAGIHLPLERQARMQELMNASHHFAAKFNAALVDPGQLGTVSITQPSSGVVASSSSSSSSGSSGSGRWRERMSTLSGFSSSSSSSGSTRRLPLDGSTVGGVLAQEPDARVRQLVFEAAGKSPASNVELLEQIILARSEMASLVGCDSYSRYKAWGASLAQDPEAIHAFLLQLAQEVKPIADGELKSLQAIKDRQPSEALSGHGIQGAHTVKPWDVDYLMTQARNAAGGAGMNRLLRGYTHLPVVLKGFAKIMEQLFGLALTISPAPSTEAWAPGVLKCEAALSDGSSVGTVFLDLCSRPGKFPGAVTFPIRCGRQLSNGEYQAPIMALLADFGHGHGPLQLTMRELRTLVHELGHCCHNLLSRTKYQHLWGTRCAQDMVEVPSHLWEHFVADPRTLRLMARHHQTDDPLPLDLCNKQVFSYRKMFSGLELQQQVLLSLVDQAYHGPRASEAVQQGTGLAWERVVEPHTSLPTVSGEWARGYPLLI